jgi:hypothetical protein
LTPLLVSPAAQGENLIYSPVDASFIDGGLRVSAWKGPFALLAKRDF